MANNTTFADDDVAVDTDIIVGRTHAPPRVLIHGVEKVGKSSWAASAPRPIFVPTEDGLDEIGPARYPLSRDWKSFLQRVDKVWKSSHDYQTLVIDSLDWLERLIWAQVCIDSSVKSIELAAGGYGKGYARAAEMWYWLLTERLDQIRSQRGMGIILVAHSKVEKAEEPGLPAYDRASPRLDKRASAIICEWCDAIGWATKRIRVAEDKSARGDRNIPHSVGGERILVVSDGKPACVAGNRYGIMEDLPLSWQAFEQAAFGAK